MLHAAVLSDFKGADSVLVWGDREGIAALAFGLMELRSGSRPEVEVGTDSGPRRLKITTSATGQPASMIRYSETDDGGIDWTCSSSAIDEVATLVSTLVDCDHGHQYLDVSGPVASQVVISVGEYPPNLSETPPQ